MTILSREPKESEQEYYVKILSKEGYLWMDVQSWEHPLSVEDAWKDGTLSSDVEQFIKRWRSTMEEEAEQFTSICPEKYASIRFLYEDEFYQMDYDVLCRPEMLFPKESLAQAQALAQELFGRMSLELQAELEELGALYTLYTGRVEPCTEG